MAAKNSNSSISKRKKFEILRSQLETERASFLSVWRELGDHILPMRPRFTTSENNRGERKNQKIINSTATLAARTLRSGMMSGVTSPARPWFRLAVPDPSLMEAGPIKDWLYIVSERMSAAFLKSNLYNVLPIIYGDMGAFGTGAMMVEEDIDNVLHFYAFPVGSFSIAANDKGRVDVFTRDFRMTVRQLVQRFGKRDPSGQIIWDNFSPQVRNQYDRGELESWIEVAHVIQPNEDHDDSKLHSKFKKYLSCYYERGQSQGSSSSDDDRVLREMGYDYFPVLCPRWEVTGEDVYGTECPGMMSLGDNKALQVMEKRKMQAVEKMVNPPMVAPTSMRNAKTSLLPGDVSFSDEREGTRGFRPAHEINPRVVELNDDISRYENRIQRCFYADLFLMLQNDSRSNVTAREIEERHEEKLLALGPVLEQLNQDLLDPLIDIAFIIMERQGQLPEPPPEIQGTALRVEYISIMAQAQKLQGIASLERFVGIVGQIAQFKPGALDKLDEDQTIDVFADRLSIQPGIVKSDDLVAQIRQAQQQAQQAAQATQTIQAGASAMKDLSQANVSEDNALNRLIENANAGQLVQQ